jgi:O-acetyl-ADP-ribose deacetylase (regulator of RNase III)
MIKYIKGNILDSEAQALINTVNTVGVMGKGVALQFKQAYVNNYKSYKEACKRNEIRIGRMFVTRDSNILSGEKFIINFPTKTDWRKPSEYSYIEDGLEDLINVLNKFKIKSVAIPPLGAGNGGLDWQKVKCIIESKLKYSDLDVFIYEPTQQILEHLKSERVKLTDARALLLYILYDLVRNGEFVSEFSSEKVCYFLQRFGGEQYFNLKYQPNFYGPYSGKVRFVLNVLNGSYIMGYSDMDKKPFEPLRLVPDGYETIKKHVESDDILNLIASKTISFLSGFYSDFSLELLSTIDFIITENKSYDKDKIVSRLNSWSERKSNLFSNPRYIDISLKHLQNAGFSEA